jgi:DNA-binding response OmpR family regulator
LPSPAAGDSGVNLDHTLPSRIDGELMSQIFVVTTDRAELNAMVRAFANAGYSATGATTFAEAQVRLASEIPDVVIADERLGAFNGLHVLLTARDAHPCADLIVTTDERNRGLEADARSLNVHCMVKPRDARDWVAPIEQILNPVARVA